MKIKFEIDGELYAISIKGTMLYARGNLSKNECLNVELMAKQFRYPDSLDSKYVCQKFLDTVKNALNISLIQVSLKHIFRIE